jgi:hypothetical protein
MTFYRIAHVLIAQTLVTKQATVIHIRLTIRFDDYFETWIRKALLNYLAVRKFRLFF